MPRKITKFKGDCLIIGGGWNQEDNYIPSRNKENFYTIDIDPLINPDVVADATSTQQLKKAFRNRRFKFIFFECFPAGSSEQLQKALANAFNLLKPDGGVYYIGGDLGLKSLSYLFNNAGFPFVRRHYLGLDIDDNSIYAPALAWQNPRILSDRQLIQSLPDAAKDVISAFDSKYDQNVYYNGCEMAAAKLFTLGFTLFSKASRLAYAPIERAAYDDSTTAKDQALSH